VAAAAPAAPISPARSPSSLIWDGMLSEDAEVAGMGGACLVARSCQSVMSLRRLAISVCARSKGRTMAMAFCAFHGSLFFCPQ